MIKDRGTKKWTAMMLPEHVEQLRNERKEDGKVKKPVLDEQQLEELNIALGEALEYKYEVIASYFKSGEICDLVGVIESANPTTKEIKLSTYDGPQRLKFGDIVGVKNV